MQNMCYSRMDRRIKLCTHIFIKCVYFILLLKGNNNLVSIKYFWIVFYSTVTYFIVLLNILNTFLLIQLYWKKIKIIIYLYNNLTYDMWNISILLSCAAETKIDYMIQAAISAFQKIIWEMINKKLYI